MAALDNNSAEKNPIVNIIDEYHHSGIKEILGMDFIQYLMLPKTVSEDLREKVKSIKALIDNEQSNSDAETKRLLASLTSSNKSPGANPAMTRPGKPKDKG